MRPFSSRFKARSIKNPVVVFGNTQKKIPFPSPPEKRKKTKFPRITKTNVM
jgi:hypothetical protein